MYMRDWALKLDDFLRVNDRDILAGLGNVSAQLTKEIAEREFERFDEQRRIYEDNEAKKEFEHELDQKAKQVGQKDPD